MHQGRPTRRFVPGTDQVSLVGKSSLTSSRSTKASNALASESASLLCSIAPARVEYSRRACPLGNRALAFRQAPPHLSDTPLHVEDGRSPETMRCLRLQ